MFFFIYILFYCAFLIYIRNYRANLEIFFHTKPFLHGLPHKKTGKDVLPELLEYADGDFWIEVENNKYELHTSLLPNKAMSSDKREKLLSISTSGKNEAGKGIMGKILLAVQMMMLDYSQVTTTAGNFYEMGRSWSLETYRSYAKKQQGEAWDELEKSIISNISDDVVVRIHEKKVEIVITKAF